MQSKKNLKRLLEHQRRIQISMLNGVFPIM